MCFVPKEGFLTMTLLYTYSIYIYIYIHTHTHFYVFIYIYMRMYMCMCLTGLEICKDDGRITVAPKGLVLSCENQVHMNVGTNRTQAATQARRARPQVCQPFLTSGLYGVHKEDC